MDVTKNKTQLSWPATYGFTTKFFNEHPNLNKGVEVGIAGGQHIASLLEHTSIEKIYGVDPYQDSTWNTEVDVSEFGGLDIVYESVKKSLEMYGDRVELIRKPSIDAADDFEDESLDFVFIDAMHDYENCLMDIKSWEPKVKSGGFVMGHDWDHFRFPGVEQAVREFFDDDVINAEMSPVHVWYVEKL
tara:strand:- start:1080 stop:1643 length:564 start_codon:yes stop_codon:yes gene_type:complete